MNRINEIIKEADARLDFFYSIYGDWDGKGKPPKPKKPRKIPATPTKEVTFDGLSAKGIVDLVKEKTGKAITISIKSKQSIIRHAADIFKTAGFKIR